MSWTTPAELRRQVARLWERGDILRARITGEPLFPVRLRLRRPSSREVADRFGEVGDWIRHLQAGSDKPRGGYVIEWREINHRVHGANSVPDSVTIPSERDALALIGRTAHAERFQVLAAATRARFPQLEAWLARRPLTVLDHAQEWSAVLAVLSWFAAHPRPGLYMRQLDIPSVDTKFIEGHRKLLAELLDLVLADEAIEREASGAKNFERRYGLRAKPALIRCRMLDRCLDLNGLNDLSVPPEQLGRLCLPVRRVFITENEINGLAFPDVPASLVIFGLGYSLHRLGEIRWLGDVSLHYWGDIDTHGFAILDRLRNSFPRTRSFLMDRATLEQHRHLWVKEPRESRFEGRLSRLTEPEQALFEDLKLDRLGECVRLEQERVAYGRLEQVLEPLARQPVC
ncbi:MAG: DUF3322 domain-containing protein [Nitrococcus sp.]|nr:DUF3322 domain-containing protein [Nitrococcus sp.]